MTEFDVMVRDLINNFLRTNTKIKNDEFVDGLWTVKNTWEPSRNNVRGGGKIMSSELLDGIWRGSRVFKWLWSCVINTLRGRRSRRS